MAEATYSQVEVDRLISMEKIIVDGEPARRKRPTKYECAEQFKAIPADGTEGIEFSIEIRFNKTLEVFSITLYGKINEKDMRPLCRYEIQDGDHDNPEWFSPAHIPGHTFHKHTYSERAIREGGRWCDCATLLEGVETEQYWSLAQLRNLQSVILAETSTGWGETRTAKLFWTVQP